MPEQQHTRGPKANSRLLAAAYNSYDKHFGPRAVEAAEADLLGETLEACRNAAKELSTVKIILDYSANADQEKVKAAYSILTTLLSKTKGPQ